MVLQAFIVHEEAVDGRTFYSIQVTDNGASWRVSKSYTDFVNLDQQLTLPEKLPLPEKGSFGLRHMLNLGDFNAKRREALQQYIVHLLSQDVSSADPCVARFFGVGGGHVMAQPSQALAQPAPYVPQPMPAVHPVIQAQPVAVMAGQGVREAPLRAPPVAQPPVPTHVAQGFVEALRAEYVFGEPGRVGGFFQQDGIDRFEEFLSPVEDRVRVSGDPEQIISELAREWCLAGPRAMPAACVPHEAAGQPPVPMHVAEGFLEALRAEYAFGEQGRVGNFFQRDGSDQIEGQLSPVEDRVRCSSNPEQVIAAIAQEWRLTNPFHSENPFGGGSSRLVEIEVRAGALVDQLKFRYSDGTANVCGHHGGSEQRPFCLREGEFLTAIHCHQGDSLDAIQFVTSSRRTSPWYGNPYGGAPTYFEAAPRMQIWSVERSHHRCGRIHGLVERPLSLDELAAMSAHESHHRGVHHEQMGHGKGKPFDEPFGMGKGSDKGFGIDCWKGKAFEKGFDKGYGKGFHTGPQRCFKCEGRGFSHDSTMEHDKPWDQRCFFCKDCIGCHGRGQIQGDMQYCHKCQGHGFCHESPMNHDKPRHERCFFCKDCNACGGSGHLR
eukprot:TRINITY_DN4181_c0_g1_i1.p1 TRINITY_DN4181_c0_g1~~TRINITY_DN4181_c0_g1_i1.p1  ORF type:complete len:606 (+),score=73.73 TRINITY_DN4181_c0_g1_i1:55-1872(+)